jgi:hypothetical protein
MATDKQAEKQAEKTQAEAEKVNTAGPEAVEKTPGTPDPEQPTQQVRTAPAGPPMVKVQVSQHVAVDASGRTSGLGGHPPFYAKSPYEEIVTDEGSALAYLRAGFLLDLDPADPESVQKVLDSKA